MSPEKGGDNFYAGVYGKYINTSYKTTLVGSLNSFKRKRTVLGFLLGYKWVSEKNILVEANIGLGRALNTSYAFDSDDLDQAQQTAVIGFFEGVLNIIKIDFISSLTVGYRFGNGSRLGE